VRNITIFTAIILLAMIVPTSIYAIQNPTGLKGETPEEIALAFIRDSATFSFDGLTSTLRVQDVVINKSNPPQYVVTLGFQCLHGGYGDRTNRILLQVITPHTAVVTVVEGKGVSAVVDGSWDEVAKRPVAKDDKSFVEAIALNWLKNAPTFKFDGVAGSAKVVDSWQAMTFAAPSFWGVTIEFDCLHAGYGDRKGQIVAQVITHHVAVIHVTEGAVTLAQIDDAWDELKQKPIEVAYTPEKAEETALKWLYGCPTFRFDGVPETVKVKEIMPLRMLNAWEVYIDFTCGYPGYGDRTGNVMLGKTQDHTIRITVIAGQVTRAIIDDVWDEMKQVRLDSAPTDQLVTIEDARDIAVDFVIRKYCLGETLPTEWVVEDLTPQGLVGGKKTRYTSGDWMVTIENAVVWRPVYTVTVEKGSDVSWTGRVDQSGAVTPDEEAQPNVPELIYTPDIARNMCIEYIIVNHPEVKAQAPKEWETTNLVPEGIVGITKVQYTGGGWTVTVQAPVVWKPTHTVSISYDGPDGAFTWEGALPRGGPVQETAYKK